MAGIRKNQIRCLAKGLILTRKSWDSAGMFRVNKKSFITLAIISIIAAVISGYLVKRNISHFPTSVVIDYQQIDSEVLAIYYDIGRGFQQLDRVFTSVDKGDINQQIRLDLPLKPIFDLRFDLEASENLQQFISIRQLCLVATPQQQCWSAEQLSRVFEPLNNIASHQIENGLLTVQTNGLDPHFRFSLPIHSIHQSFSKVSDIYYAIGIVLLAFVLYVFLLILKNISPWAFSRVAEQSNLGFSMSVGSASALVALVSILLSGVWMITVQTGLLATLLLICGVSLIAMLPGKPIVSLKSYRGINNANQSSMIELFACSIIAVMPLLILFIATWQQEFPHLGDHEYHLWGNQISYQAIQHSYLFIVGAIVLLVVGYWLGLLRWIIPLASILLLSIGLINNFPDPILADVQGIFSRYPGGARILAQPFVYFSSINEWFDPLNTGRLVNVLSVPIWLLVLRPLIIGRFPTISILPFIFVFFWQAEVVYLFSTAYLDIWCVIFVLLALEKLIVSQADSENIDDNGYLKSCLLLSLACAFKEPAIFLIPWFWISGWSFSVLKSQSKTALLSRFYYAVIVGFASVLPFLVYYVVRKAYGVSRYAVTGFEYFLTNDWFAEMSNRIAFHFGALGSVFLMLMILLWLVVLCAPIWKKYRWMMICLLGAFISQIFLFNWDSGGMNFTGYLRFYLPALIIFFAPVILIFVTREQLGGYYIKAVLAFSVLAIVVNAPLLYAEGQKLNEPDSVRNFNEHYDAPIYLPIRYLIKQAEQAGVLEGEDRAIHINYVTAWNQPAFVYPDLLVKYKLNMNKEWKCGCSAETPSVLAPFVYMSGLNQDLNSQSMTDIKAMSQHQSRYVKHWREVNEVRDVCLIELRQTCQYFHQQQTSEGVVVGAIGVGAK